MGCRMQAEEQAMAGEQAGPRIKASFSFDPTVLMQLVSCKTEALLELSCTHAMRERVFRLCVNRRKMCSVPA
jgi:hypothetical protein